MNNDINKDDSSGLLSVNFTRTSDRRSSEYSRNSRNFRRRAGDSSGDVKTSNLWLVSFTDVIALMLTFFVLLFSMATPSQTDWASVTSALQQEFSKFYGAAQNRGQQDAVSITQINFNTALSVTYLASVIQAVIDANDDLYQVDLIEKKDHLIVSLPFELLFDDPASERLSSKARLAISLLGESLSSIRNKIEIVGYVHPEDLGGDALENKGNTEAWQRSALLAAQVAAVLEASGYRPDLTISGGGFGRYIDMSYNSGGGLRDTMARRVNIIILNHDGRQSKVF